MSGRILFVVLAIAGALSVVASVVSTVPAQAQALPEDLTIRVRGTTGDEIVQVRNGNQVLEEFTASTNWEVVEFDIDPSVSLNDLSVGFVNNQHEPVDRNLLVDWVQLGSDRRQAESPDVWSTGKWSSATGCTNGPAASQTLNCAGFLHFGGEPTASVIEAHAVGATGTENLELLVDGVAVSTRRVLEQGNVWSSNTETSPVRFTLPEAVDHGRLRIAFTNDGNFEGADRNVRINAIEVDGASYETGDSRIESLGTWSNGAQCGRGFFGNETLACDGWFQLPSSNGVVAPDPELQPDPIPATPPAVVTAPALTVQVVADGLTNPWGMAFLPSGELLFSERLGRMNLLTEDGVQPIAADFTNLGLGTSGLLGVEVDANFTTNRRIYTCQGQDSPARQQVVAWELSADLSSAIRVQTLVDIERTGAHSGCRLGIGIDGYLWATLGDDFVASTPQDPTSLHGKVLRIDPMTGAGHPDNAPSTPELDPRIYSWGHRNPQGLSFHPGTNQAWIVEHGPDRDDEINALQSGGNFGWDPVGPEGPAVYDELGRTMTDLTIEGAVSAAWSSGPSTIAPGDIAFLVGEQWGEFQNAIAMPTLKDERLHLLRFDDDGAVVDTAVPSELDRSEYARLRSALMGPDGALYVTTSNSGFGNDDRRVDEILRVTPTGFESDVPPVDPPPTTPPSVDPPTGDRSIVTVRARGTTGTELLGLEIDGEVVRTWTADTEYSTVSYAHQSSVEGSQVRVSFTNDGLDDGRDRNVFVDFMSIGGERFDSEHPTVRSSGAWANGARCREGTFNTDFLACNGWFQYADDGGVAAPELAPAPQPQREPEPEPEPELAPTSQRIEVRAVGTTGEERIELQVDGETVATFELTRQMASYLYEPSGGVDGDEVRVEFVNDGRTARGADRNARVDFIVVDDETYQSEDPSVFSTGTYLSSSRCAPGAKQSEWLHCNGYFSYMIG